MLTFTEPETFKPREKSQVDRLRDQVDELVSKLDYPPDMIARALLVKGADTLLQSDGPFAARWAISRTMDLMTGFWTPDTVRSFVESYQK